MQKGPLGVFFCLKCVFDGGSWGRTCLVFFVTLFVRVGAVGACVLLGGDDTCVRGGG